MSRSPVPAPAPKAGAVRGGGPGRDAIQQARQHQHHEEDDQGGQ